MIVDNEERYIEVCKILETKKTLIIPIASNISFHTKNTELSVLYVYDFETKQSYLIPISHPDVDVNFDIPEKIKYSFVPSKNDAISLGVYSENLVDLGLLHYFKTGHKIVIEATNIQSFIDRNFWNYPQNSQLIPILKLLEYCKNNRKKYIETIIDLDSLSPEYLEYNRDALDAYFYLENSGINTNKGLEYTKYNLFTTTGRPSNTFNGINYAALNKEDGSRDRFISRFENGMMVEFDFDSYHLRLIANLIGYNLPDESVHEYLGKYYFGKEELTPEEYQESKRINFKILYGGIPKEFKNIEFFRLISNFISKLWQEWKSKNYVNTYLYKRRMHKARLGEMNPQKLFNYYIQAYETEHNIEVIKRFKKVLAGKETKVVLCTYDSFLFDFNISDGLETLKNIKSAMKIPSKVSIGANYGTMIDKLL